jgi:hypothetical protein
VRRPNVEKRAGARDDPAVDLPLVTLGGGILACVGAVAALWSVTRGSAGIPLLPALVAFTGAASGVALIAMPRLRGTKACHLAAGAATAGVTSAVATSAAGAAAATVLYVPVVLYAAYFLTKRATVAMVGIVAVAFTAVAFVQDFDEAQARAAILFATLVTIAGAVRLLRDRVFNLILALDRTPRTDALTGVLNRLLMRGSK